MTESTAFLKKSQPPALAAPISRAPETDAALDQRQLFALGLEHIRALAGRVWTDHNLHDPGITSLELLCFALTDLAYRAKFPIEDLLAAEQDNVAHVARQFFTAARSLPNQPLTEADYRKLIIDLPDVKNAWLEPAPLRYYADTHARVLRRDDPGTPSIRPVDVRGLYNVRLALAENVQTEEQRQAVIAKVREVLHAHRNLCEDFVDVAAIETHEIALCAEVELTLDADPVAVAAQLLFTVQDYLDPPVRNYSLSEMLERTRPDGSTWTVPELFEGPLLEHGFIDDDELVEATLRRDVRLSDLISLISDLPGVSAVRDILVNHTDGAGQPLPPVDKWRILIPDGRQPRLSKRSGRLVFYKRGLPVLAVNLDNPPSAVTDRLKALNEAVRLKLETLPQEDVAIPQGRYRQPARYHSVQHHFPALYGLSAAGLPAGQDGMRRVHVLQLKAYLLFFDQLMANYLAQLSQAHRLLSLNLPVPEDEQVEDVAQSYFAQVVESLPDYLKIYATGVDAGQLAGLLETAAEAQERRGRFLDHLLARFAEDFHQYAQVMRSAFGGSVEADNRLKSRFLRDLDRIGAARARAYDYSLKQADRLWDTDSNISGIELRLARLLGFDPKRRNLSSLAHDIYAEVDKTPNDEFRFRVRHPNTQKILLSGSTHYATPEATRAAMMTAVARAQMAERYERKLTVGGQHYFNIVDEDGEVIARRIEYFDTAEAMEAAITESMLHLRERYSGEGLYLIENLLLRPEDEDDPFLPICVDPNCTDCADDDPYSYRVHVVLPAHSGRYANMNFRRFVEETIRVELPAHIQPKVCWINTEQMAGFESAYRDWLELRASVTNAGRKAKLARFRDVLYAIKNIYPANALFDCAAGDVEKPHFILGRSALGSVPRDEDNPPE